jgi:tryptophan halogenase
MAKNVVIVGGGTAGWMTAAYLRKALDKVDNITVVESGHIGSVGVGEATFSTLKLFFDFLGLQEEEWMPSCNASYKLAIKFANWTAGGGHFYHPFQRLGVVDGFNLAEWWLKLKRDREAFDYACFTIPAMCDAQRSPRYLDGRVFDDQVQMHFTDEHLAKKNVLHDHSVQYPYGYHFDASLLAKFLMGYAMKRGVKQVIDDVVDVGLAADGSVSHIQLKERGAFHGDLFVDCTGFRGLVINKALGEPFISFNDSLLCDSAVAMQIPSDPEKNGINPYTSATALSSGWVWNIPLYHRTGTGYVYSSQFLGKDDAEKELRAHLGPASEGCRANHIKMRVGRNRNSWVKNCVAIGLSSGFVEPLESTGIFFIQHGIEELVSHFPHGPIKEDMARSYNRLVAECIDGVREFLTLHYCVTNRTDTEFWRATKTHIKVPEDLTERLREWKTRLPNARNINMDYHGFEFYSYACMLLGLGWRPDSSLPVLDHRDELNALAAFKQLRRRTQHLVASLPSVYQYLTHVRRGDEAEEVAA